MIWDVKKRKELNIYYQAAASSRNSSTINHQQSTPSTGNTKLPADTKQPTSNTYENPPNFLPSRELTYHLQKCLGMGYLSSQEGILSPHLNPSKNATSIHEAVCYRILIVDVLGSPFWAFFEWRWVGRSHKSFSLTLTPCEKNNFLQGSFHYKQRMLKGKSPNNYHV